MALDNDDIEFVPPPLAHSATDYNEVWTKPDQAWQSCSLLSLDGGGVRGYWTLLVLNKLVEQIAYIEQNKDDIVKMSEAVGHSFHPERYPKYVSQKISDEERKRIKENERVETEEFGALDDNRRYLLCHYFDFICGSSTGALIAIMLGRFRMTVRDCLHEYQTLIPEIFGKPRIFTKQTFSVGFNKYSTENVEKVFQNVTSRRCDSAESRRGYKGFPSRRKVCKTFATSLVSECRKGKEQVRTRYLIRSYDHMPRDWADTQINPLSGSSRVNTDVSQTGRTLRHPSRKINFGPAEPMEVWQVARAAIAAPLYFRPFDGPIDPHDKTFNRFVDGGLHSPNNPTMEGVQEVWGLNGPRSLSVVLSVGTARTNANPGRSLKKELTNIIELGNDPQIVDEQVDRESRSENGKFRYFRLNDPEGSKVAMDECVPRRSSSPGKATFAKIENHFNGWLARSENTAELRRCAILLVRQRRARIDADRGRWETFSTGSEYRCRTQRCEDIFSNRYEFQEHMRAKHNLKMGVDDKHIKEQCDVWWYQQETT